LNVKEETYMTIAEIIKIGTAPNPAMNTTVNEGKRMCAALAPFMNVDGVYINTTVQWPAEAAMIPAEGLDIPAGTPLYLHVQVSGPNRTVTFGVANWWRIVAGAGMHDAVVACLDIANPDWHIAPSGQEDADKHAAMIALVEALPGVMPAEVEKPVPPAPAMPDWDNPRTEGVLGPRIGDLSPDGAMYTSPSGAVWEKKRWLSMFEWTWKRIG